MDKPMKRCPAKSDVRLLVFGVFLSLLIVAVGLFLRGKRSTADESDLSGGAKSLPVSTSEEEPHQSEREPTASATALPVVEPSSVAELVPSVEAAATVTGAEPTATPSGDEWRGKVIDKETRQPIAGAAVEILNLSVFQIYIESPKAIASVTTDEEGKFRLPVQARGSQMEFSNTLRVSAAGYESVINLWSVPGGAINEPRERVVELGAGATIMGRVVDAQGAPVACARVGMTIIGGSDLLMELGQWRSEWIQFNTSIATTGSDGSFVLEGLAAGEMYQIPVVADGYLPKVSEETTAGSNGLVIVLEKGGGSIFGKVEDSKKRPIKGAVVIMIPKEMDGEEGEMLEALIGQQRIKTAVDGTFQSELVKTGVVSFVAAGNEESLAAGVVVMKQVNVGQGEPTEVVLSFPEDLIVEGVATNIGNGMPLEGVRVSSVSSYQFSKDAPDDTFPAGTVTHTAGDGSFRLAVPRSDLDGVQSTAVIWVTGPQGWILKEPENSYDAVTLSNLADGEKSRRVDLKFQGARTLQIQVKTPLGDAAAKAFVNAYPDTLGNPGLAPEFGHATTDANGLASVTVEPCEEIRLLVNHKTGFHSSTRKWAELVDEPIVIKLDKAARIAGFVRTAEGTPLQNMTIMALNAKSEKWTVDLRSVYETVVTNEKGYYYMDGLPPQPINLALLRDSGAPVDSKIITLTVGEFKEGVDFVFSDGETLRGQVIDEDGNPVSGASIICWSGDPYDRPNEAATDAAGVFELKNLKEDQLVNGLQVTHSDYQPEQLKPVKLGDPPVSIKLFRLRKTFIRVVEEGSGAPVTHYRLIMTWTAEAGTQVFDGGDSRMPHEVSDPKGRTTVTGLRRGQYLVQIEVLAKDGTATGLSGSQTITIGSGLDVPQEILIKVAGGPESKDKQLNGS